MEYDNMQPLNFKCPSCGEDGCGNEKGYAPKLGERCFCECGHIFIAKEKYVVN